MIPIKFETLKAPNVGADFLKNLRDTTFNKDLSNEPIISAGSISQDSTFKSIPAWEISAWVFIIKRINKSISIQRYNTQNNATYESLLNGANQVIIDLICFNPYITSQGRKWPECLQHLMF